MRHGAARCLLTGTASAGVPWEGASTLSTEDYNPATVSVFAEAAAFEE
jgi:hypothetical protein